MPERWTLPDGITMKVVENAGSLFHPVQPPQPDDVFEDEDLDKVAGGTVKSHATSPFIRHELTQENIADQQQEYVKVVARAWSDEAFKVKLLSDPATALREMGVTLPDGMTMKVVQDTDSLFHLVLPPRPDDKMKDEASNKAAEGPQPQFQFSRSSFNLVLPPQPDHLALSLEPSGKLENEALDKVAGRTLPQFRLSRPSFCFVLPRKPDSELKDESLG